MINGKQPACRQTGKNTILISRNEILAVINNIAITIGRSLNLEEILNTVQEELLNFLKLRKSIIYLVKDARLEAITYRGFTEGFVKDAGTINIGDGPAGRAVKSKRIIFIDNIASAPCEIKRLSKLKGIKGCIFLPLKSKERVMGILTLCSEKQFPIIKDIDLLESLSNHVGTVIENALLFRERERAYEELKSIQDRLVQMETLSAIGKLTAGLAHEIGTPLNIIAGRAELLLSELGEDDKRSINLKIIISQIERITTLVKQLLILASGGKTRVEDINVNNVITSVLNFMEKRISDSGIKIETFLGNNLPSITIDPNQLQQMLINIISNSTDATPRGGKICIRTYLIKEGIKVISDNRSFISIEISDTGCGIEEVNLDKIFDPFFTTKKTGEGTGLGLAITRNIVREYGGDIEVKSAVGKGTTFIIRFPITIKE